MDLLIPHSGTVIWMLIAFLTVFFLLKKFAWKPILNALKLREETIENALKSAEETKLEMANLQTKSELILAEAKLERDKIIKEARNLKDGIVNEAKQQAAAEADKIIESVKNTIKVEKEAAINEIKEQSATLAIFIAEKLLQEKLSGDANQKELIDRLLKDVKLN
jgi:F-type H+-transporting ATPase subunit b